MKMLLIFLIFTTPLTAQYVDLTIDPNKATGLIDNPRTETDHKGIDWDIEAGVDPGRIAAYLLYGEFREAEYRNYGAGIDFFITRTERYSIGTGPGLTMVMKKYHAPEYPNGYIWLGHLAYAARATGQFWITEKIGITGRVQFQARPDLKTHGILEGSLGIRYQIKNHNR